MKILILIFIFEIKESKISTDCVHASSVNMFKNKIDKYLVKAGYT